MTDPRNSLNVLAPASAKPKLDYLHRQLYRDAAERSGLNRRELLGLGALGLLAAACGGSTNAGGGGGGSSTPASGGNTLAGKPMESSLIIYNWSQYDAESTFKQFESAHPATHVTETFYSSNDELLAKLSAGGTGYDIIVPSQNAVAQLVGENSLIALDKALLPNLKNLDASFLKPSYDPTGEFHVIKDFGITMFFYMNTVVTDHPKTMLDFYNALPKWVGKGRTNVLDGAEEVVPLALMAIGLDPEHRQRVGLRQGEEVPAQHPQGRDDDRLGGLHQRLHRRQDHSRPGLERRRAPDRAGPQEAGRHHARHPHRDVRGVV